VDGVSLGYATFAKGCQLWVIARQVKADTLRIEKGLILRSRERDGQKTKNLVVESSLECAFL
jgi:hypothetical protein